MSTAKAKAKEMARAYEDRPTAVLPGSDGTVGGNWLDDDGNPIDRSGGDEHGGTPSRGTSDEG